MPVKTTNELRILAAGLKFPEGPVALNDGSVVLVECAAGRITRIKPDGTTKVVAQTGAAPNGLAIGPDGKLYVCNKRRCFYISSSMPPAASSSPISA